MVHFVGAGPGAADLITIRGRKHLEEAIVITASIVRIAELCLREKLNKAMAKQKL